MKEKKIRDPDEERNPFLEGRAKGQPPEQAAAALTAMLSDVIAQFMEAYPRKTFSDKIAVERVTSLAVNIADARDYFERYSDPLKALKAALSGREGVEVQVVGLPDDLSEIPDDVRDALEQIGAIPKREKGGGDGRDKS